MNISLENWLRAKLDEVESMHEYSIATDTVRALIDIYNDLKVKEVPLGPAAEEYLSRELNKYNEIKVITNE